MNLNDEEKEIVKLKSQFLLAIMGLILFVAAGILAVIWFGWKLLIVLFIFMWANNIQIRNTK